MKRENDIEKLRLYKIVIFGPSRAGKSSLFQVLLGNSPRSTSESTGVYHYKMFRVAVITEGSNSTPQWYEVKLEKEISRLGSILEEKQTKQPDLPSNDAVKVFNSIDVEDMICQDVDQPDKKLKDTNTLMVCYDSGGQSEFFDLMPLLATNPTGYIMVLDMRNGLDKEICSRAIINDKEYSSDTNTTKNLMKNALASIQPSSAHVSCENLLVAGTHLDKCVNEEGNIDEQIITRLDSEIQNELVKDNGETLFREYKDLKRIKTKYVHPVANYMELGNNSKIKEISDHSFQQIRVAVEAMSKNNKLKEEISVKSLLFLYQLQLEVAKPPHYISKTEYSHYIKHCQLDKGSVDELLEYFHKLGFIFYFKKDVKDVVFSPQWVFDQLSNIIFEKYINTNGYIIGGEIKKIHFDKIFQRIADKHGDVHKIDDEGIDHLLKIFTGQNIMAKSENEEVYFMPALLSPGSFDDESLQANIKSLCGKGIYERLHVSFKDHYFPRAIFCYLSTELMRQGWEIQSSPRHSNILIYQIPHSNQYVGLFDLKTELVVELYIKKNENLAKEPHEITELLFKFITGCCRQIQIQNSFQMGFTCNKINKSNKSNNCKLFAGVKLQYPFLPEKYCEKCKTRRLTYDELVWLTPPKVMVCNHCDSVSVIIFSL